MGTRELLTIIGETMEHPVEVSVTKVTVQENTQFSDELLEADHSLFVEVQFRE